MVRSILFAAALVIGIAAPAGAGIEQGLAAYIRGDFATALRQYREPAGHGEAAAQFALGLMHHRGEGVPQGVR